MRGLEHGHGMESGRGGRGAGRMGGGRFFAHGGLRWVMLQLIADKPSHGYELIRDIEERLGGQYSPSPGTVYPTLTLLEEQGYITQTPQEGGRNLCAITESGRAYLQANRETADAMLARLHGAGGTTLAERPPQVVRAIENFKLALRMRLARAPLTDEQAHAVAAILDGAAQNIERI